MPEPFEPLRETLLRAGVAPGHVRRYLRELSEHFADLRDRELEAGKTPTDAEAAARSRLGADEALAEAMLARPALRSWTARAPWAMLVIGPLLLLILAWMVAALGVILVVASSAHAVHHHPAWLPPKWLAPGSAARIGTALLDLVQVGGPLLIAAWVALLAARQRSRLIWPLLGCVVVAVFGASLVWNASWPMAGSPAFAFSMGLRGLTPRNGGAFSFAVWSQSLAMAAFSLAVATTVYWRARGPGQPT